MDCIVSLDKQIANSFIKVSGSKSETNRLLLLQALFPGIAINNASYSDDSIAMRNALNGAKDIIDVHHAGTAMRFLTAYFAVKQGSKVLLTGSPRMKERPIGILVDALKSIGADIQYAEREGYPPLKITGKYINANKVNISADTSSQYITALLLIAPSLQNGLEINLKGEITSLPYIEMTLSLLARAGISYSFIGNTIRVKPQNQLPQQTLTVESDWSSASYYYSIVALSPVGTVINLASFREDSIQGDSALKDIYKNFGVETTFDNEGISISKIRNDVPLNINLNLNTTPDLAQTIAVTCLGLGINCNLNGLHTLRIKETDRLQALKNEMEKFGAKVTITDNSLVLSTGTNGLLKNVGVNTYNDHRMAMAFAPLAVKTTVIIKDAGVVSKSYPAFWNDLQKIGFTVSQVS
ncbi:3-phosphoshikimate 1-carboxyvinyltransferase [Flavobacterium sp. MK4S-17]|uniref:3-phosphoshikimate 1-carboxyvinyltransferase n=1 Tax=Flavobacterium sp. MK4S-17 TaxID=2543737 RepID=UPI00135AE6AF|nr:3-phosphoshikimate 1-carboxyvinyltransferase [Flavobacterium sp. MK4S-17]